MKILHKLILLSCTPNYFCKHINSVTTQWSINLILSAQYQYAILCSNTRNKIQHWKFRFLRKFLIWDLCSKHQKPVFKQIQVRYSTTLVLNVQNLRVWVEQKYSPDGSRDTVQPYVMQRKLHRHKSPQTEIHSVPKSLSKLLTKVSFWRVCSMYEWIYIKSSSIIIEANLTFNRHSFFANDE